MDKIPNELVDLILLGLANDTYQLARCRLVCKRFLYSSTICNHWLQDIPVRLGEEQEVERLHGMLGVSGSTLLSCIQRVRIEGDNGVLQKRVSEFIADNLSLFNNLKTLEINDVSWGSLNSKARTALTSQKSLTSVNLWYNKFPNINDFLSLLCGVTLHDIDSQFSISLSQIEVEDPSCIILPEFRQTPLIIDALEFWGTDRDMQVVTAYLANLDIHVEYLAVMGPLNNAGFNFVLPIIQKCGPTLETVILDLPETWNEHVEAYDPDDEMPSSIIFSANTSLKSLQMEVTVPPQEYIDCPEILLRSLATLSSTCLHTLSIRLNFFFEEPTMVDVKPRHFDCLEKVLIDTLGLSNLPVVEIWLTHSCWEYGDENMVEFEAGLISALPILSKMEKLEFDLMKP